MQKTGHLSLDTITGKYALTFCMPHHCRVDKNIAIIRQHRFTPTCGCYTNTAKKELFMSALKPAEAAHSAKTQSNSPP